jgi:hypothetical protein
MIELGAALASLLAALMSDRKHVPPSSEREAAARLYMATEGYRPHPWTKKQALTLLTGHMTCPMGHKGPFEAISLGWIESSVEFRKDIDREGEPYWALRIGNSSSEAADNVPVLLRCKHDDHDVHEKGTRPHMTRIFEFPTDAFEWEWY